MGENVHQGHFKRLRKQFLINHENFSEHQVLELILTYISVRRDVNPLAHRLIETFGSLNKVLTSDKKDLLKVKGVTERIANYLTSFPIIAKYYKESEDYKYKKVDTKRKILNCVKNVLQDLDKDDYLALSLTFDDLLLAKKKLTSKMIKNETYIREIVGLLLSTSSQKTIIVKTINTNKYVPTIKDIIFVKNTLVALRNLEIILEDVIIIYNNEIYSFKEEGILKVINAIIFEDKNLYYTILNMPNNKLFLMKKSSEIMNDELSDEDKIIITACQFASNLIFNDFFS